MVFSRFLFFRRLFLSYIFLFLWLECCSNRRCSWRNLEGWRCKLEVQSRRSKWLNLYLRFVIIGTVTLTDCINLWFIYRGRSKIQFKLWLRRCFSRLRLRLERFLLIWHLFGLCSLHEDIELLNHSVQTCDYPVQVLVFLFFLLRFGRLCFLCGHLLITSLTLQQYRCLGLHHSILRELLAQLILQNWLEGLRNVVKVEVLLDLIYLTFELSHLLTQG